MRYVRLLWSAILAGNCIAFGGTAFLSTDDKVVGAALFAIGLSAICLFKLNLYTGKVCYLMEKKTYYLLDLAIILLGNVIGAAYVGHLEQAISLGSKIQDKAIAMCTAKISNDAFSTLILAVLCNALICIAVEGYRSAHDDFGRFIMVFLGVMCFIVSGFEHCIANAYYITVANMWSMDAVRCMIITIAGNSAGGVLFYTVLKISRKGAST